MIDTERILRDITGWSISPSEQWISRKNKIPTILEHRFASLIDTGSNGLGIDSISKLKLYVLLHK